MTVGTSSHAFVFAGVVDWFSVDKGYGFVLVCGGDGSRKSQAFLHAEDCVGGWKPAKDDRLTFELEEQERGWRCRVVEFAEVLAPA